MKQTLKISYRIPELLTDIQKKCIYTYMCIRDIHFNTRNTKKNPKTTTNKLTNKKSDN